MAEVQEVAVGIQHGEDCTCHKLDPVCVTPVVVHDDCPGVGVPDRPRKPAELAGRIAITWPAPRCEGAALPTWRVQIHDLDADQPILTATGLRIVIGGDNWDSGGIYADLTLLVDDNGEPIPNDGKAAIDKNGGRVRTGAFRYAIAEMRTAKPQ